MDKLMQDLWDSLSYEDQLIVTCVGLIISSVILEILLKGLGC